MAVDITQRGFLTVPEAAAELGVSRDWAYQHLPVIKLGKGEKRGAVMRVRQSDLEAFIARRERGDAA